MQKMQEIYLKTLPTPNGMGRRHIHAAFILYKTLGYEVTPKVRHETFGVTSLSQTVVLFIILRQQSRYVAHCRYELLYDASHDCLQVWLAYRKHKHRHMMSLFVFQKRRLCNPSVYG